MSFQGERIPHTISFVCFGSFDTGPEHWNKPKKNCYGFRTHPKTTETDWVSVCFGLNWKKKINCFEDTLIESVFGDFFGLFWKSSGCFGCFNTGPKHQNKPFVGLPKQTEKQPKQIEFRFELKNWLFQRHTSSSPELTHHGSLGNPRDSSSHICNPCVLPLSPSIQFICLADEDDNRLLQTWQYRLWVQIRNAKNWNWSMCKILCVKVMFVSLLSLSLDSVLGTIKKVILFTIKTILEPNLRWLLWWKCYFFYIMNYYNKEHTAKVSGLYVYFTRRPKTLKKRQLPLGWFNFYGGFCSSPILPGIRHFSLPGLKCWYGLPEQSHIMDWI